ncbi:hypothetical protein RIF29_16865 [Crotalaria pallida]|uniref:Uncharacterized protein n=1 Tax=Crotalaria pallida TaxID=3830 RepID=A0AAN9FN57_CROPI
MDVRITFVVVVCVLQMMVASVHSHNTNPFIVKGRVYCDPCRVGYETPITTYIPGAVVILQCKDKITNNIVYNKLGKTDSSGTYTILVDAHQENQICEAKLVSSPKHDCIEATPGRDRSRVILNRFNGIATDDRFVNNMGFMTKEVASGCARILRQYPEFDNDENY